MLNMNLVNFQHRFPVPCLLCTGREDYTSEEFQSLFFSLRRALLLGKEEYAVNSTIHKITEE